MLLMGKSTISMAMFNSYVKLPEDISMLYPYHVIFPMLNTILYNHT